MPIPADIYKKLVHAKVFIDEHFDSPIDLDAIAGEACISRFHFHRLFRRIYKRTPHQYLTSKRIDHARRILAAADCSVGEVCMRVGFESIGSFSMLFKKEIGVAPGEYRAALKLSRAMAEEQPRRVIPHCFIAEIISEKSNIQEAGDAGKG
ncbi:MAG TPA: AraC family transcriptional regulator [Puia sp.]|jgi:AraC-like DNA-binding protein|nr:AraC family transcriptional regulator [Puia sp.]